MGSSTRDASCARGMQENYCSPWCLAHRLIALLVSCLVAQSCPTLCESVDCSPPGSSILQARILERVAIPFSRDLPIPGIEHESPALQADALSSEPLGKPHAQPCNE